MAKTQAAKGKALVAKLRSTPGVRDAEALAAWIGRRHGRLKPKGSPGGKSGANSGANSKKTGETSSKTSAERTEKSQKKSSGGLYERLRAQADREPASNRDHRDAAKKGRRIVAPKPVYDDDDDPFGLEDWEKEALESDDDEQNEPSKEDRQRDRYESRLRREREKEEKQRLYRAIMEMGGLKTSSDDVASEYRQIPKKYKRKDGMAGDEMAEYLAEYYPDLGIESEADLIEYLSARDEKTARISQRAAKGRKLARL